MLRILTQWRQVLNARFRIEGSRERHPSSIWEASMDIRTTFDARGSPGFAHEGRANQWPGGLRQGIVIEMSQISDAASTHSQLQVVKDVELRHDV